MILNVLKFVMYNHFDTFGDKNWDGFEAEVVPDFCLLCLNFQLYVNGLQFLILFGY